ncbi:MAG: DUF401 family protein, partial [Planctomycetota bacterium]
MVQLIIVAASFAIVVVLLQCGWKVGRALTAAVLFVAITLSATPAKLGGQLAKDWTEAVRPQQGQPSPSTAFPLKTLDVLLLVTVVGFLGRTQTALGIGARMSDALVHLFRSRRLALAGVPAVMGLMPTPGGIMLSAPLVKETARRYKVPPQRASLVNYWFRHQWEYLFPLYPAVPVMASETGLDLGSLMLNNLPVTVLSLIVGAAFLLTGFPSGQRRTDPDVNWPTHLARVASGLWPIAMALVLCLVVGLTIGVALTVASLCLVLAWRVPWPLVLKYFRQAIDPDFLLVIAMAMFYGQVLQSVEAVEAITRFLNDQLIDGWHLHKGVVVFAIPFIVGASTGVTVATIALTFPLLGGFMTGGADWFPHPMVALAITGALMGI